MAEDTDHAILFSLRTFCRAASPMPDERTNPEMVTMLGFPRLMVPS